LIFSGFATALATVLACDPSSGDGPSDKDGGGKADDASATECAGFAGLTCEDGDVCIMPDGTCNVADIGGTCKPPPQVCLEIYAPVCGCDGQTYSNRCSAESAGASIDYVGACGNPPGQIGDSCGGFTINGPTFCAEGLFCDYEPADFCGFSDIPGTCQQVPDVCNLIAAPVCGCDSRTYGNDCFAAMEGIGVLHDGACEGSGTDGSDTGGSDTDASGTGGSDPNAPATDSGGIDTDGDSTGASDPYG
jgi:hypothetical protein